MEQQRPLLYLTLIFLGFMLWTTWQASKLPPPTAPSTTSTQQSPQSSATSTGGSANQGGLTNDIPQQTDGASQSSPVAQANNAAADVEYITVKTNVFNIQIATTGGDIVETALPTYPISIKEPNVPITILDRNKHYSAQSGLRHKDVQGIDASTLAPNHYAVYASAQTEYKMADGDDTLVVPLTWTNPDGITVTKQYTFKRDKFVIDVEHIVNNQSKQNWSGFEYRQLRHGPAASGGGIFGGVQAYVGAAYYDYKEGDYSYEKVAFNDFNDPSEKVNKKIPGGWAAMLEHYFVSAWVPQQDQNNTYYTLYQERNGTPNSILGLKTDNYDIAPGASYSFKSQFYAGPKIQENLEHIATGLELTVDYGIFTIISKPIFITLKFIHSYVGNWGWSIILVTILIKLIFFWPSAVSYRSMAKMKKLAPKMKEMQERHKDDPQAKQKAMMEFYKKEKINPFGSCLPMLIQIPVFMGLYWVLLESVELRQAPWIFWYKDLSIMDPFFVLPILMGVSMFVQQKLNPPQMDPMQQKIFTWLPVVFTALFLFFPAGLVLYWVVNNVLSIAQQWFINKKIIGEQ